jgi:AraC-like DNA-binding protein
MQRGLPVLTTLPAAGDAHSLPDQPLLSCDVFSTTDPDEAVAEVTRVLSPHTLDVRGNRDRFQARVSYAPLSDVSLCHLNYEMPVNFHCVPQDMFAAVVLPRSEGMTVSYESGDTHEVPIGSLAVVPWGCRVDLRFDAAFSILALYAKLSALSAGLRRIAPDLDVDDLVFEGIVATQGVAPRTFVGLASMLVGVVDQYSSPTLIPSKVADTMSDQVVSTFLLGLPHNRAEQMLRYRTPISRRAVKLAVDMIAADDYAENSVSDIAANLGISLRSLELGFRKEFGCTPNDYVRRFRLQRAHDQLRHAHPGDGTTVTDVALRWGFNHPGRFAALFRSVYGVPPAATLRTR